MQRIKSAMEYQGFIALWFHANAYRGAFPSSEGYKLTNFLQVLLHCSLTSAYSIAVQTHSTTISARFTLDSQ